MLFKGQAHSRPYLILSFDPAIMEFMPVPDLEVILRTGWRLALPRRKAGLRLSAWVHRPTWLELDVMNYILACWSPILPHRWDLWGR